MAKRNYSNRYYDDNKQNSIANSLLIKEETADSVTTTNTTEDNEIVVVGPVKIDDTVAAVDDKKDLKDYEIVKVLSFEKMKALCDVYVRTSPEKKSDNIDRILKKGETIQVFGNSGTWAKVEGDRYVMREFLG